MTSAELEQETPTFPLDLMWCPRCTLVQIGYSVSPELLFREYLYFSSVSGAMVEHAGALVRRLISERRLDDHSLVVEIGSNDGYLLQHYRHAAIPVLGIEPAVNVARDAKSRGIPTLTQFFDLRLAHHLVRHCRSAAVIHAHNVLAHVADLNGVVAGIGALLEPGGVAVIEVPYLRDLVDRGEFDTIYHEHLCYFSLTALVHVFERHGLVVTDVERVPIHGGSLRLFLSRMPARSAAAVSALLEEERQWGVADWAVYERFAETVGQLRRNLVTLLQDLKSAGKRIAAYGAAAKGSTLLNFCGIGIETIDFIVDRNPHKQGRFMPGSRIPIYAPQRLLDDLPDYCLLLTWNFADEIRAQQAEYLRRGGQFMVPAPQLAAAAC